ncbi:MAG: L,D-transpeptidase family protein [Thermomicrobiales bacterium]|nr:L,D-transpeptidase family protein [Thermomicrobiales bacterium]
MGLAITKRIALWLAIAAVFAMVIGPLGATLAPAQLAAAQETTEATPATEPDPATEPVEEVIEPAEGEATPSPDDPIDEPTDEPTEEPATPTADDPVELTETTAEQIIITTYCYRAPEMTRVDNTGDTAITVLSIQPVFDGVPGNQYLVAPNQSNINAGSTKIYRSGPEATSGTVLTTDPLYNTTSAQVIEVEIATSAGTVLADCGPNPNLQITVPTDIVITLNCTATPETSRIDNNGTAMITINSIESLDGSPTPITVNRNLGAGRTVIYRSNYDGASGTLLTTEEFYTDTLYENDGIRLNTSIGVIEKTCATKPPTYPSQLEVTMDCKNLPEWVKIKNVGQGPVTITGLESLYDKKPIEPFTLNKTLQPGQGVIYRSGTTGNYANVLTSQYLYSPNVGESEGARIFTKTGKTFVVRCPGSPRIEVNLTTQTLYAYEGNRLIRTSPVTTGKDGFNTPTGRFSILTKEGTIRMAACSGGECWDVPNVPHSMLFREGGFYLHGAYWHNNFGNPAARSSHGCVNLPLDFAAWLFSWANYGTEVWIHY